MISQFENMKRQIKDNITVMINHGQLDDAKILISEYMNMVINDPEVFSMQAIIAIQEEKLSEAESILNKGLIISEKDFDLNYNLAHVYILESKYVEAAELFWKLSNGKYEEDQKVLAIKAFQQICKKHPNVEKIKQRKKLIFFVKQNLDSFLGDIIAGFSDEYDIKKLIIADLKQIDIEMQWADICWFEWCDELITYASKLPICQEKIVLCRLHSYEAFTDFHKQVHWENVDRLIFVAEHIRNFIVKNNCNIKYDQTIVIPNGININKYTFKQRKQGFNIAYVGYINYKKGPMLLLHTFYEIHKIDSRYKLYIAGTFQDHRDVLYFQQMIQELNLKDSVFFTGWQDDLDSWLEDKNYILCTSILESQNMSVMQAMSKGIKPLIHNFVGAKEIYTHDYVWSSIDQCINLLKNKKYNSNEYREFIDSKYSLNLQIQSIEKLFKQYSTSPPQKSMSELPLVTIGIINYNQEKYLKDCLESIISQDYPNKEILIIDDCSTDNSLNIINQYISIQTNIKLITHEVNSGSGSKGVQDVQVHSRGKYFTFIDGDDYYPTNDVISAYVAAMESDDELDFVYGDLIIVDSQQHVLDIWKNKNLKNSTIISSIFKRLGSNVMPMIGLYKKSFYKKNSLKWYYDEELKIGYDTINCLLNLKHNWKKIHIDKACLCYRKHNNNITSNIKERVICVVKVAEFIIENFNENEYFQNLDWNSITTTDLKDFIKNFHIGSYFYEAYRNFYDNNSSLQYDILLNLLIPLEIKIEKYFTQCAFFINSHSYMNIVKEKNKEIKRMTESLEVIKKKTKYKSATHRIKELKREIVNEGQNLRNKLIERYQQCYLQKNFRVLIYSPDNGAWKYSFISWKNAMESMGIKADIIYAINPCADYGNYNILITIGMKFFIENLYKNPTLFNIRNRIGIAGKDRFSDQDTNNDLWALEEIKNNKTFQFLLSSFHSETIKQIYLSWLQQGITIHSNMFSFNPLIHFPENAEYAFDYFFVGHNSYLKVNETKSFLFPILQKYTGFLGGTGWGEAIKEVDPLTIRKYYNKSKININFHLDIQKQYNYEVNERTYIICACGGFQLVDNPQYLKQIYSEKEVAIAENPEEYLEMFEYYLHHEYQRLNFTYNGLIRTYQNNCSIFHRLESMLSYLEE